MKKIVRSLTRFAGRAIYNAFFALVSLALIGGTVAAIANYAATQGAGTTFGSVVNVGVHYAQMLLCDPTTSSQCAAVSAGGVVSTSAAQSGTWNVNNVAGTVTLPTGAATSANQTNGSEKSQIVDGSGNVIASTSNALNVNVNNANTNGQKTSANSSPVVIASDQSIVAVSSVGYPTAATPYTASATGTTGSTTATLAGAVSVTTYLCGFSIRANATAAVTGNAQVTGTITGTLNFTQWTAPLASGLGVTELAFNPCVPASASNTSIAVVSAAPGTGGTVSVSAWGYKL